MMPFPVGLKPVFVFSRIPRQPKHVRSLVQLIGLCRLSIIRRESGFKTKIFFCRMERVQYCKANFCLSLQKMEISVKNDRAVVVALNNVPWPSKIGPNFV